MVLSPMQFVRQGANRIVRAAARSIPITAGQKVRLVYRQQDLSHCDLQQLVLPRGDS